MLKRNTITKIALGVAVVALLFSVITLIRAIVIGSGVMFAAIQVIGTLIIVSICAIMLYVLRNEEPEELSEENEDKEKDLSGEEKTVDDEPASEINEAEENEPNEIKDKYNFDTFE